MLTQQNNYSKLISFFEKLSNTVLLLSNEDNNLSLCYVSDNFVSLVGGRCDTIQDWFDCVDRTDRDRIKAIYHKRMLSGATEIDNTIEKSLIYRINGHNERTVWVREDFVALYEQGQPFKKGVVVLKDISSQYANDWLEDSIDQDMGHPEEKKRFLASLLPEHFIQFAERSFDVLWIRSADYRDQLYVNPAFESIWGISRAVLYKTPEIWFDYLHPDDIARMATSVKSRKKDVDMMSFFDEDYRIQRSDGTLRYIKDTSFPVYDSGKNLIGYAGIARDVTEEKEKHERLLEQKRQAELADRTKSNFLAMVSHELRTPLHGIMGLTQVLDGQKITTVQREMIGDIHESANHLLRIVNDLLDFSKLSEGKITQNLSVFDLRGLVNQITDSMRLFLADKNIIINTKIALNVPKLVESDPMRLRQVLVNLITNAIEFTHKGKIDIEVKTGSKRGASGQPFVQFEVIDTGIGIAKEAQQHVFDSFYQVESDYRRRYGGTGLGLSICKQLVSLMGGDIWVESVLGKGSRFVFSLPMKRSEQLIELGENVLEDSRTPKKMEDFSILVVEDNRINRKVIHSLLSPYGCHIHMATSGAEAMDFLKQSNCDLIFMDIGLPDMDGLLVTQKIRHMKGPNASVPIVAVTAHAFENDRQKCIDIGMNGFLVKPISIASLKKVLLTFYHSTSDLEVFVGD